MKGHRRDFLKAGAVGIAAASTGGLGLASASAAPAPEPVVTLQGVSVAYGKAWAMREVTASFRPGAVMRVAPSV